MVQILIVHFLLFQLTGLIFASLCQYLVLFSSEFAELEQQSLFLNRQMLTCLAQMGQIILHILGKL